MRAVDFETIAIFPFENVGDREENEILASRLHPDLQKQLGRLPELRVTSPMSVSEYRASYKGLREIAYELEVNYQLHPVG